MRTYLDALPDETFIESLEQRYTATGRTPAWGRSRFGGKVDRIDRRDGKRIILDYKTGSVETFNVGHFEKVILPFALPAEFDYEGLKQVREALADLQLPLYVMLVATGERHGGADAGDAAEGGQGRSPTRPTSSRRTWRLGAPGGETPRSPQGTLLRQAGQGG